MFLMIEFPVLTTLSFSVEDKGRKVLHVNFISSLMFCENLPSLKRLILEGTLEYSKNYLPIKNRNPYKNKPNQFMEPSN